ncbi:MAG: glycosyltransferase family 2 protein [Opitutales bacterium]|nr:glycosyltransferase family 2 protein [Opitutales bacterium]
MTEIKPIVLIPSYNTGDRLLETVEEVLHFWPDVMVVFDGGDDGRRLLKHLGCQVRFVLLEQNRGKGGAVLAGIEALLPEKFTHVLVFDADGQHCAQDIPRFMEALLTAPHCMISGIPVFGPEAPVERVKGRVVGNTFALLETAFRGVEDVLYGMRIYPAKPLLKVMRKRSLGMRYGFDTEASVRLFWDGFGVRHLSTPVTYFQEEEGGVSHFHYVKDNGVLILLHIRLLLEAPLRLLLRGFRCKHVMESLEND